MASTGRLHHGNRDDDLCSLPRFTGKRQISGQRFDPLAHADRTKMIRLGRTRTIHFEAPPVVPNPKAQFRRPILQIAVSLEAMISDFHVDRMTRRSGGF